VRGAFDQPQEAVCHARAAGRGIDFGQPKGFLKGLIPGLMDPVGVLAVFRKLKKAVIGAARGMHLAEVEARCGNRRDDRIGTWCWSTWGAARRGAHVAMRLSSPGDVYSSPPTRRSSYVAASYPTRLPHGSDRPDDQGEAP
jgi:hypothetical protein